MFAFTAFCKTSALKELLNHFDKSSSVKFCVERKNLVNESKLLEISDSFKAPLSQKQILNVQ